MASGRPPGRSGNLSDKTVFQLDDDDLMSRLWMLMKDKEKVKEEITRTRMEIEEWLQVLSCSSAFDLEQLIDEFSNMPSTLPGFTVVNPLTDLQGLAQYSELATELNGFELLDCSKASTTVKGDLLIRFPWRPPCRPDLECSVLLKPGTEHTYSLGSHNLPPTVPLEDLVQNYLQNPRHGPDGVRKFVAVLGQYTRALYARLQQVIALEGLKILNNTAVNYNKGATRLAFTVDPRLKNYPKLLVEFVLKFHPLDILPETVTARPLCLGPEERVPPRLQEALEAAAQRMKTTLFPEVLMDLDRQGRAAHPTTSDSTSSSLLQQQEDLSTTTAAAAPPTEGDSESDADLLVPLFDVGE